AAVAFASVYVSRGGSHLRSLGDFTFIPALYIASQLHAIDGGAAGSRHTVLTVVAHIPLSIVSVTMVLLGWKIWRELASGVDRSFASALAAIRRAQASVVRMGHLVDGDAPASLPTYDPLLTASMHGLAVLAAAAWISTTQLAHGEWAIISAAAVVTGELHSVGARIRDRLIGVTLGALLGLAAQTHVPQDQTTYAVAVLGLGLSSVAFTRYAVAFASRCFFVVISAAALGQGPASGLERVETVIAGGAIGLVVSLAVPAAIRHLRPAMAPRAKESRGGP
ncbi:MAG: FUSC family protein, partial [Sphingopyxis terrae]